MITLRNISKSYGNLEVLHNIDLDINDGEIVAIMGPSGAGKTTLLQIAGTLDHPDQGTVMYREQQVTSLSDKKLSKFRNSNIGFVFQFHQLLPEFTALENVALPAMISGMSRRKAMAKANELLGELGLSERATHKPGELSGGERQRIAFARSLINNPQVIFADEPTGSLDSHNRDEILRLISDLRERYKQTFVIVTHDPTLTSIADRVINMKDGRITDICVKEEETNNDDIEPLESTEETDEMA
jgi:lipoprotein-releasing system ATP-binding protein